MLTDEGSFDEHSYKLATIMVEIIGCLGKISIEFGDQLATAMAREADNGSLPKESDQIHS